MPTGVVLSPWLVIPVVGVLMLMVAGHIGVLVESQAPASRRRIRIANGWVMLMELPMLGAGFGFVDSNTSPRLFALVWVAAIALLGISIGLAILDVANTLRLNLRTRRRLRRTADTLATRVNAMRQAEHE